MVELVRMSKSGKSVVVGLGKSQARSVGDDHSSAYFRQYYLRNKDAKDFYASQQALRNKDKKAEYKRRYDRGNNEWNVDYRRRNGDVKSRYLGEYKTQNKERFAKYREGYRRAGRMKLNRSWKSPDIVRDYLDSIASRLNISNYEEWYRISRKQLAQNGGSSLFEKFGSLGAALHFVFPEINWNLDAFSQRGKKSGQRWLKLKIEELLPGIIIVEEYQHPDLNWVADSDQHMVLDLWIPQHRIGIEFQGEQHYFNIDSFGPSSGTGAYSERDTLKNSLCNSQGITLIAIPYWWDGTMDSLSATLYQARPDVFPVSHGRLIPREMPAEFRDNSVKQSAQTCDELKYLE